jgi:hypothetical protein
VFVYFTQGREQGVTAAELDELARDSGRADTGGSGDTIVARIDAATQVREGQEAELWVDGRAMHVFDPATGRNLSLSADDGGGGSSSAQAGPRHAVPDQAAADDAAATDGTGGAGGAGPSQEVT